MSLVSIENKINPEDEYSMLYDHFQTILFYRVSYKRSESKKALSQFSQIMLHVFSKLNWDEILYDALNSNIDEILTDCEIFHDMNTENVNDTARELSYLSVIYVNSIENRHIYNKIVGQLDTLNKSYPGQETWIDNVFTNAN